VCFGSRAQTLEKPKDYIHRGNILSIFVRKLKKHRHKLKENKNVQQTTTTKSGNVRTQENTQQSQSFYSNFNPNQVFGFQNNFQSQLTNSQMQIPHYQLMNINPFLPSDPKKTEELVRQIVYNMFEEIKQSYDQRIFNVEKNQAQHENILNQIFTEIKTLKNNKNKKKPFKTLHKLKKKKWRSRCEESSKRQATWN